MFEGKSGGGLITCHHAWSQLFFLEEIGEEVSYQGSSGNKWICLSSTTPSTKDSPFSIIDGLGGQSLRGCDSICCLLGETGLT